MRTEDLSYLLSAEGRAVLGELAADPPSAANLLATADRLRRRIGSERASAAIELIRLRQRATRKFTRAGEMFFTREGLEQATAEPVANHRARRFAAKELAVIADLGCGIGGDALALAGAGPTVIAIDLNPIHAALTRANAAAYGVSDRINPVVGDLRQLSPLPVDGFFFDPARRTTTGPRAAPERRLFSANNYQPPLSLIDRWRPIVRCGAAKVSPGIDYAELPADVELELVSLDGDMKEALLWFDEMRTTAARRATLLPAGVTLTDRDGHDVAPVSEPQAYLIEPDGAVIRAHLVTQLATRLGAALIDPRIAYLTSDEHQPTPFARGFRIDDYFPFQLKQLRAYLRHRNIGHVTIKKRGSPLDPDDLRQALRLRGDNHAILFLTQIQNRHSVLIGHEIE